MVGRVPQAELLRSLTRFAESSPRGGHVSILLSHVSQPTTVYKWHKWHSTSFLYPFQDVVKVWTLKKRHSGHAWAHSAIST